MKLFVNVVERQWKNKMGLKLEEKRIKSNNNNKSEVKTLKNLMKKFIALFLGITIASSLLIMNHKQQVKVKAATPKTVLEKFRITSNINGDIRGDITYSQSGAMGNEGIFLDKTYKHFNKVKDVKPGDIIDIKWTEKDYENDIWDNIYSVKVEK
jgi:hypothetical protein